VSEGTAWSPVLAESIADTVDSPTVPRQRDTSRPVSDDGPTDAVRLGRGMRLRLFAAVQALLADPSLAGLGDAARLSAVVLYAKSRAPQGREDDNQTSIWGSELGRWLGMSESTVHHKVLPTLRKTGALHTQVVTNTEGQPTGLACLIMPLWRARHSGDAAHPLALSKVELATLLRLIEALFGPGWAPKYGERIPPGILASRTGKGAATDRLGLLLMVLNTRASGWLNLCGGSVVKREGRVAATLARLLGCSPYGTRKVLARLAEAGVVERERRTTGTRMNGRGRVLVLPVARAYRRARRTPAEAVQGRKPVLSERPDSAAGDHALAAMAGALGISGTYEGEATSEPEVQERPDGAEFHADHTSLVTLASCPPVSGGFSGEGRREYGDQPKRAREHENQIAGGDACGQLTPLNVAGRMFRREQPKQSLPISGGKNGRGPVPNEPVRTGSITGQGSRPQKRVPLPVENLRAALAPIQPLWARLEHPAARHLVEAAVRTELTTVEGFAGPAIAPRVLADRLARRLEDQIRLGAPIKNPVGWMLKRGLPQRQMCGDVRCDEGALLDSGRECPRCDEVRDDRRDQRRRVAASVDAVTPHASKAERRAAIERQLHDTVTAQAWVKAHKREEARTRRAAAKARAGAATTQAATSETVALAPLVPPAPHSSIVTLALEPKGEDVGQELVLEELTREQVLDWRTRAAHDHQVVFDHIEQYGEHSAKRLFTCASVERMQRLARLKHLDLGYIPWGQE